MDEEVPDSYSVSPTYQALDIRHPAFCTLASIRCVPRQRWRVRIAHMEPEPEPLSALSREFAT